MEDVMKFHSDKAIFIQIADRLCDEILEKKYQSDDRIPAVREYAVMLEVNTNTAMKAYELLARDEIIYNKRGLGYFVSPTAEETIRQKRVKQFVEHSLPSLFKEMILLQIDIETVIDAWQKKQKSMPKE